MFIPAAGQPGENPIKGRLAVPAMIIPFPDLPPSRPLPARVTAPAELDRMLLDRAGAA